MLADFVLAHKDELVRQIELHAADDEGPGPARGRHGRIAALVEELIHVLQSDDSSPALEPGVGRQAAVLCHERGLVRRETLSEVVRRSLPVPPSEMMALSDWASAANELRLEERVRRLSDLLDDMHDGAAIIGRDNRIEYLNRSAAAFLHQLSGVPMDQLLGKSGAELGLPKEIDFAGRAATIEALARRRASREEQLLGRWQKTRYRAISSDAGDLEAIAFVHSDIHEHKLAELRLELLSRLSAIIGSVDYEDVATALASIPIPDMADWCAVNLVEDGRILGTSVSQCDPGKAALRDAFMRAASEWTENPLWTTLKLTSGFQLLTDVSDELLRKLTVNTKQYAFMKEVGVQSVMVQPVVSRGQIVAIFNLLYTAESGRRYGRGDPELAEELALHAAHIIENARLLRDLRASEARFRIALTGAKTVVFEQDAALRYRWFFNPLAPVNLSGRADDEVFSPDDAAVLTALKRPILAGAGTRTQEVGLTLGGERRIYRESLEGMHDHAGRTVGVIGSAIDITDEKRMQQQLREAVGFRERIMGVLGHDLRNPLNAAKMAATTLLQQDMTEAMRGRVDVINRATDRMTEMIETLLDVTRVRSGGGVPIERVPTDLGALAREVTSELAAVHQDRALYIDERGDVRGQWDPARLRQAISNLVANAAEHGDPHRPVRISVDGSGEAVVVTVRNEGPPIPPELRPVLFEAFSRGDSSPGGLGLGLFIVREIAVAHGGTIDAESSAETGTVFTLVLPRDGCTET
jgi:signal transduction histidine kinase